MRVAVMGTGAVGGYFGAKLAAAGDDVVFIARKRHLPALRREGLRIELTEIEPWATRREFNPRPDEEGER